MFVKRKVPVVNPEGLSILDWNYEAPTGTCTVHTTPAKTVYKNQFIISNSDGTYKVIAPFNVELLDGSSISLPAGTLIQIDKSFSLPDGTAIMPYDVNNYPDLEKLKGTPVKENAPASSTPSSTPVNTNTDALIDEQDSSTGN